MSTDDDDPLAPTLSTPPRTSPLAKRVGVLGAVLAMSAPLAGCQVNGETRPDSGPEPDANIDAARPDAGYGADGEIALPPRDASFQDGSADTTIAPTDTNPPNS